jgi:hypothetical protein
LLKGFSIEIASMGVIFEGMGRFAAPLRLSIVPAEDARSLGFARDDRLEDFARDDRFEELARDDRFAKPALGGWDSEEGGSSSAALVIPTEGRNPFFAEIFCPAGFATALPEDLASAASSHGVLEDAVAASEISGALTFFLRHVLETSHPLQPRY